MKNLFSACVSVLGFSMALGLGSGCVPTTPEPNPGYLAASVQHQYSITAPDRSIYTVGKQNIDSGTQYGAVPVMLIEKYSPDGERLWRKNFPESPSAQWLSNYAHLAERDLDGLRATIVVASEDGGVYVTGVGISDEQIMSATRQHNPDSRGHNQTLLKFDANGNLLWEKTVKAVPYTKSARKFGSYDNMVMLDDRIYLGSAVYSPTGEIVRDTGSVPKDMNVMGDYFLSIVNDCEFHGGYSGGGCSEDRSFNVWRHRISTGVPAGMLWIDIPEIILSANYTDDGIYAVLGLGRPEWRDFSAKLVRYDIDFNVLLSLDLDAAFGLDLWVPPVTGVPAEQQIGDGKPLVAQIEGEKQDFYALDFVAAEKKMLVAKLDNDMNIVWQHLYDMTGVENGVSKSRKYKLIRTSLGDIALFYFEGGKYNLFRFNDDGVLLDSRLLQLPAGVNPKFHTVDSNDNYMILDDARPDSGSPFVLMEEVAAP